MKYYVSVFLALIIVFITNVIAAGKESGSAVDPRVIPVITMKPQERKVYPIAIIGAGAAGTMAVKRAVLNNNDTLLFTGAKQDQRRSRGTWVRKVDNIPGLEKYARTILELRNETVAELARTPLAHKLFIIEDSVQKIEKGSEFFILRDGAGHEYYAKYILLATGMMDVQPEVQGSIRPVLQYANGQTIAYCVICDGHQSVGRQTVVIGHSEAAGSIALLLSEKYQPKNVTILTNGKKHEFSPELLKQIESKKVTIVDARIQKILGNKVKKQLAGFLLETGDVVDADIGFVALGVRPNNQLAVQLGAQVDEKGLVIADTNGESSVPNLFVIGDLRSGSMKQIYTAWQHAVDSVQLINRRIRETPQ